MNDFFLNFDCVSIVKEFGEFLFTLKTQKLSHPLRRVGFSATSAICDAGFNGFSNVMLFNYVCYILIKTCR